MKKFLLLFTLGCLSLTAKELIQDPEFKKAEKYWYLKKSNEYKTTKEIFKKGQFSTKTKFSSEDRYYFLMNQVELEVGKTYKLSFEAKAKGEGTLLACYRNNNDVYNKKKGKPGRHLHMLGLKQEFTPSKEWQKYEYAFVAQENKTSDYIEVIMFMFGAYTGEIFLKNVSLSESNESLESNKELNFGKKLN